MCQVDRLTAPSRSHARPTLRHRSCSDERRAGPLGPFREPAAVLVEQCVGQHEELAHDDDHSDLPRLSLRDELTILRAQVRVVTGRRQCRRNYGSPRVHDDLIAWQERVSRKCVVRFRQEEGRNARVRKRYTHTTMSDHDQPVAANLLDRRFEAAAPNQRWGGDTTEFVIATSGQLYLAVILDLFSRFVVGWALSAVNDRHLTIKALEMALKRRCLDFGLLHHSDQGCTYASEDYQDLLDARGIVCSMNRRGNCYDNAVMESFFSTVKNELADQFASHGDAKMELFDYIEERGGPYRLDS